MASLKVFLSSCLLVVVISICSPLLTGVNAKFSLSSFKPDFFSRSHGLSARVAERSRVLVEGSDDPCAKYAGRLFSLPTGHPCAEGLDSTLFVKRLDGVLRQSTGEETPTGNHPPGVGKRPLGEGKHPPGEGKQPLGVGKHPPGVGKHPPGVGKHPPGVGKHPPGKGHHPPGTGHHPPGVGGGKQRFCNSTENFCRDPENNPRILNTGNLEDSTSTTCCSRTCRSTLYNKNFCGGCVRRIFRCRGDTDTCCLGTCVNTNTNSTNCGRCGNACSANEICTDGQCVSYT